MTEIIVFFIYMIGMLGIGVYWQRKTQSSEEYLLGGRSIGPIITALTLQTTSMSGYMFMGGPAYAYNVGWFSLFYAVGDAGGSIVNLSVLGRRMRRLSYLMGCLSPIEYLEKRYESAAVKIIASAFSIVFIGAYILAQFLAAGKTLSSLFHIPFVIALIIGVGVVVFYVWAGGYMAVAWTDFFQGIIMVTAMAGILFLGLLKVGGLTGLNTSLAAIDPTLISKWGKGLQFQGKYGMVFGAILIYLVGYMGAPHVVIRHMAMESTKTAKSALVYATVWTQFFVFSPYILGLIGIVILPNLADPELVVPTLAFTFFPGIIAAIIITAIMSAVMSTCDALVMTMGTILSRDIYQRFFKPNATDRELLIVSRIMIIVIGLSGLALALIQPPGVFGLVIFSFGALACSLAVPYVAAVYSKKANACGCIASMLSGGLTNIVWTAANLEDVTSIHPVLIGLVVSIIAMLIFCNFGQKISPEIANYIDRSAGKAHVPKGIRANQSKMLAPEANAVTFFLVDSKFLENRGFNLAQKDF